MKTSTLAKQLLTAAVFAGISLQFCRSAPVCGGVAPFSEQPMRASRLTSELGIGVHMGSSKGPYGKVDQVVRAIDYLGIKHVRDSVGGALAGSFINGQWDSTPDAKLQMFAASGIHFDVGMGSSLQADLPRVRQYAQYIESIEGPNEPEFTHYKYAGLDGTPAALQIQRDLYAAVKSDPVLASKQVMSIPFAHAADTGAATDLAHYADTANVHTYATHGVSPRPVMQADLQNTADAPNDHFVITETGYPTNVPGGPPGARNGPGHSFVDEDVQAKYVLDAIFDAFDLHVRRTYLYELLDETPDLQDIDPEKHYGLFHTDYSPKPAAVAVHNLMGILHANQDQGDFPLIPFPYTVQANLNGPAPNCYVYSMLIQRAAGVNDVVIWAEPPLWTPDLHHAPPAAPINVVLSFPIPQGKVRVFDPLISSRSQADYKAVQQLTVQVTDHPVIVETVGF